VQLTLLFIEAGEDLLAKIEAAKAVTDRPSIIKVRTVIGIGSVKEGTEGVSQVRSEWLSGG
jgi:transketolase